MDSGQKPEITCVAGETVNPKTLITTGFNPGILKQSSANTSDGIFPAIVIAKAQVMGVTAARFHFRKGETSYRLGGTQVCGKVKYRVIDL